MSAPGVCPQQPTEQRPDRSTQETAHKGRFATLAEDADGFMFGIRTAAGVSRRFARRADAPPTFPRASNTNRHQPWSATVSWAEP